MLKAPHFLVLCCIAVLSELVAADKGKCPTIPKLAVRWDVLLKNVKFLPLDFIYISYYWDTVYDAWKMRCDATKIPPKPKVAPNHFEGVLATDNTDWVMYMYCDENEGGHNKTIETFTTQNMAKLPTGQQIYQKIVAAHKFLNYDKEHFYICQEKKPIDKTKKPKNPKNKVNDEGEFELE